MTVHGHAWAWLVGAALVGAWLALALARWWRGFCGSWRARVRAARAGAGEGDAAAMLRAAGFRIVAAQARTAWTVIVDDEPFDVELRADYVVEAGGERLIAEVKTGAQAPRLSTAATRRQLLEYQVAFEVDGVLLVSPERGTIQRVEFLTAAARRLRGATESSNTLSNHFNRMSE